VLQKVIIEHQTVLHPRLKVSQQVFLAAFVYLLIHFLIFNL
jgi:hypothetical protein